MLNAIKTFFDTHIAHADEGLLEHRLRLATAALMVEMMYQDERVVESELDTIRQLIERKFKLSDEETRELFKLAHNESRQSTDYFQFTRLINEHYDYPAKVKVIEYLWIVAYADGSLDPYEEHMVRKIADLIYVEHKDFIRSKHKVLGQE